MANENLSRYGLMELKTRQLSFLVSVIIGLCLLGSQAMAQSYAKYLVLLKDKAASPYSTTKPEAFLSTRSINRRTKQGIAINTRDLPVNPSYITAIRQTGAKVWYSSRWLNAVYVETDNSTLQKILQLSFVKGIEANHALSAPSTALSARASATNSKFAQTVDDASYGNGITQAKMIGATKLHNLGFQGEGMLIGVFDAGFKNANTITSLKPLFDEKRIIGTYDFVKNNQAVYEDDEHGTMVLSCMGADVPGSFIGTSPKASFLLLRSEDADTEYPIEEANWLIAAEYADSVGVDLINSSLGYSLFDDVKLNYTYQNMDGKTTIAARAADWAAATGIVVCISAGNEGAKAWKYIATPADADSVLAVGAVTSTELKASFSSFGPSADGRVKPDLMAMGQSSVVISATGTITNSSGTSFASPILCGMAACYWQQNPSLTAMQVIANLRKAGNRYTTPTPEYGYGIPFGTIINTTTPVILGNEPTETNFFQVSPNPFQETITLTLASYEGKPYQLVLMNVLGNTLWSGTLSSSSMTIPTENLQKGIYFLRVMNEEQAGIMKLVAW